MPLILGTNSIKDTGYDVANSVRFNDNDSPSMYKTPGSSGNRRTWTFSTWFKRGNIGSSQWILDAYGGSSDEFHIYISSGNAIGIYTIGGGFGDNKSISTSNLVRDCSAWYHLVVRCDTTQGTASNRLRIYLNGTECSYGTYNNFDENGEGQVSESGTKHWIGRRNAGDYFDGYLAETVLVDGSSLAPTSFGEYDSDTPTIWKPIDVSGLTFGTNGFYLDYEDSSNLGNDANGGTDFTEANLAATDQATDTPTNNFCTLNSLTGKKGNNTTFLEGNLKSVDTGATDVDPNLYATFGLSAGTWYFEMKAEAITAGRSASIALLVHDGKGPESYADATTCNLYYEKNSSTNKIRKFASDIETGLADNAADDIFGVALDIDNGTVQFYKNGSTYGSQVTGLSSSGKTTFISMFGEGGAGRAATCNVNFGNPAFTISSGNADANGYGSFEYTPVGYALCTKNLAEFGG